MRRHDHGHQTVPTCRPPIATRQSDINAERRTIRIHRSTFVNIGKKDAGIVARFVFIAFATRKIVRSVVA